MRADAQAFATDCGYTCQGKIFYRQVNVLIVPTGYNHTFWYLSSNYQGDPTVPGAGDEVWDAGPNGTCIPQVVITGGVVIITGYTGCGNLVDWVTNDTVGHYTQDDVNTSTLWQTTPYDNSSCPLLNTIHNYGTAWDPNQYLYVVGGSPNSNSFVHWAANAAGLTFPTPPPSAPGW